MWSYLKGEQLTYAKKRQKKHSQLNETLKLLPHNAQTSLLCNNSNEAKSV